MPEAVLLERRPGQGLRRLERLMAQLRGPGGCPWDREQTLDSLRSCLLEETYELLEAMEGAPAGPHLEELGDVLLQVVFQAQIRSEQGDFTLDDVAHGIAEKLIRRHPHVFGDRTLESASEVVQAWEAIKRREGQGGGERPRSPLAGVPRSLPALLRAQRVQAKCEKAGFAWDAQVAARPAADRALEALDRAAAGGDAECTHAAFGELLFALAGLAQTLQVDAESALRSAVDRFAAAFRDHDKCAHGAHDQRGSV